MPRRRAKLQRWKKGVRKSSSPLRERNTAGCSLLFAFKWRGEMPHMVQKFRMQLISILSCDDAQERDRRERHKSNAHGIENGIQISRRTRHAKIQTKTDKTPRYFFKCRGAHFPYFGRCVLKIAFVAGFRVAGIKFKYVTILNKTKKLGTQLKE